MTAPKPIATLTIIIDFDEIPESSYLDEIMDKAREFGAVQRADLEVHTPHTTDLRGRR